jgi:cytochrome c-type biogenesis protein CcmH
MTGAFLSALTALIIFAIATLFSDNFLTFGAQSNSASNKTDSQGARLRGVALPRWRRLTIAALLALAVTSLSAHLLAPDQSPASSTVAAAQHDSPMAAAYDKLRQFAAEVEAPSTPLAMSAIPSSSSQLPDVETMVVRLAARLAQNPNDAEGWRMLGWSYFNTSRYAEAVAAYDKAIALDPGNAKLAVARDEAKSAFAGVDKGPSASDIEAAAGLSAEDRSAMIAGMVDGLAEKLASSPNDEAGWLKLIRSRMVLGQKEAAARDLEAAKQAFSTEPEALERLTEAARALGIPGG